MTRINLGRDEWWPVPVVHRYVEGDWRLPESDTVDIPEQIITAYEKATIAFGDAERAIIRAVIAAGEADWEDYA